MKDQSWCWGLRHACGLLNLFSLMVAAAPSQASTTFQSVLPAPAKPTTIDAVILQHNYYFSSSGHELRATEIRFDDPQDIRVDLYVAGPDPGDIVLTVIVFRQSDAALGQLAPGTYDYTSRLVTVPRSRFPSEPDPLLFTLFPSSTQTGQFTVLPVPGDTDADGDIDDADLGTAFANYSGAVGNVGKSFEQGDTDGDGDIDDADLGTAFAGYTGALSPTQAPEPSSIALLALSGLLVARPRR